MVTLPILLLITLLLPLAVFVLLQWIGPRLGEPLAGYVGIGGAMTTFGLAVVSLIAWLYGGSSWGFNTGPLVETFGWLPIGHFAKQRSPGFLDLVFYVDSLTIVMIASVTFVSAIVHLFSLSYMRGDGRYAQFFAYLSLFVFAMLALLTSGSLVQLLIAWELVGLCSYLLINFWHEKGEARAASVKTMVTQRVGDVGFITGMGILIAYLGSTTLPDLWIALGDPAQRIMPPSLLSVVGVLLCCGAMAKSAQFPFHAWLPDATAGPTPVSALIHATTLVAAGVFLLARVLPILTPDARLFLVIIGAVTIGLGSLCALAQRDIKKALAMSTMAQLGLMVLAIGVGSWVGALFHLLTHAFCNALLFLCAGTVIHAMNHETRLEKYGGLYRRLPVTAVTFAISGLAMSAAPYLSGFYSKELLLGHVAAWSGLATEGGRGTLLQLALWVPVVAAYLTPLYLTRLWMLTFAGRTRNRSASRLATEPGIMSFSLVILSGMAVVAGYTWFPIVAMVEGAASETRSYLSLANVDALAATWPTLASPSEVVFDAVEGVEIRQTLRSPMEVRVAEGVERAHRLTSLAWALGVAVGILMYARAFALTERIARWPGVGVLRRCLREGFFFDDLYALVFAGAVTLTSTVATSIDGLAGRARSNLAGASRTPDGGAVTAGRGEAQLAHENSDVQVPQMRAWFAAVVVVLALAAGALLLVLIQRS